MRPSRGFASALAGVAMTIFAWIGPWSWPAWPALAVLRLAFPPERSFAALPFGARATIVALMIALNVAVWGVVAFLATSSHRSGVTSATE
ncbi:MAG: hypothetical protein ACSLFQ_16730 [Thermoanaerobaculia bacterium]